MENNKRDEITLDIIKDSLYAIGEEMFLSIARTSKSPIIYEVLDFASGITDSKGRLLTQGNGVAGFLGMLSSMVNDVIDKFTSKGDLKKGDIIIINTPYSGGGSHLSDVGLVMPVFYKDEIVAYCANKCHWSEVGGKDPGFSVDSSEIYQEGIQFPCIKLFEEGEANQALMEMIKANVRLPDLSIGDMWAQISGLRTGEKRVIELCDKYTAETVENAIEKLIKNSAAFSKKMVSQIPNGEYFASDIMDGDILGNGPFNIQVKVTVEDEKMIFDFTGSAKQTPGPINLPYAGLVSGIRSIFLACTNPAQEVNDGVFEPLEVIAEKGSIFSATRPAAVSVYYESMQFAQDLVWRALAPVLPDKLTAGHFLTVGAYTMVGAHPVTDEIYVNVGPTIGGWGAGAGMDGDSAQFCTGDGETYNIPVELLEAKFGLEITEHSLNINNGGAGEYRGGFGVVLGHKALNDNILFSGTYGRHDNPAWGFDGGEDGTVNSFDIIRADGTIEGPYGKGSKLPLKKGDILRMITGTGGGYGNPLDRPVEKVVMDIRNEYITIDDAKEIYGVMVDPDSYEVTGVCEGRELK